MREGDHVEGDPRRRPHRVDVREGICGRNATEVVGVIDDRGEEVNRLDQRQIGAQPVNGRVVGGIEPDDQVRGRGRDGNARESRRADGVDLAGAAGPVGEAREPHVAID